MLKEVFKYVVDLAKPEILEIGGQTYSDKSLNRISYNPKATEINMTTLSSLVDYIRSGIDTMQGKMVVHVKSPTYVSMYSALDHERKRENMVEVNVKLPEFAFDRFIDHESFCIALQSKFIPTEDRALLLKFAGTVEAGTVAEYGDDGITQKATIKTGIAAKSDAIVPSPVKLKPFRTFVEVDQPWSQFIFRMQGDRNIQCALFEADGGAWKLEAMESIKEYLKERLKDYANFIIIS
jgi:hypothetical protein